jgi:hypothetical protein
MALKSLVDFNDSLELNNYVVNDTNITGSYVTAFVPINLIHSSADWTERLDGTAVVSHDRHQLLTDNRVYPGASSTYMFEIDKYADCNPVLISLDTPYEFVKAAKESGYTHYPMILGSHIKPQEGWLDVISHDTFQMYMLLMETETNDIWSTTPLFAGSLIDIIQYFLKIEPIANIVDITERAKIGLLLINTVELSFHIPDETQYKLIEIDRVDRFCHIESDLGCADEIIWGTRTIPLDDKDLKDENHIVSQWSFDGGKFTHINTVHGPIEPVRDEISD